ncbi:MULTISPECIES: hypothetical protein [Kamptonema]|nr:MULTISPECIES: hypothetical protein [Kamptonema]CBN57086.1 hypothetical protein OSCI_3310019 [Kamptonema sp. PCC 6506]
MPTPDSDSYASRRVLPLQNYTIDLDVLFYGKAIAKGESDGYRNF